MKPKLCLMLLPFISLHVLCELNASEVTGTEIQSSNESRSIRLKEKEKINCQINEQGIGIDTKTKRSNDRSVPQHRTIPLKAEERVSHEFQKGIVLVITERSDDNVRYTSVPINSKLQSELTNISQADLKTDNRIEDLNDLLNRARQTRFAVSKGKLGKVFLKIHTIENAKESVTSVNRSKAENGMSSKNWTVKPEIMSTTRSNSTSSTVAPIMGTRQRAKLVGNVRLLSKKQKFWDQINVDIDRDVLGNNITNKISNFTSDNSPAKKENSPKAHPTELSKDLLTIYSDMRKKLFANTPRKDRNDRTSNQSSVFKILNTDDRSMKGIKVAGKKPDDLMILDSKSWDTLIGKQNQNPDCGDSKKGKVGESGFYEYFHLGRSGSYTRNHLSVTIANHPSTRNVRRTTMKENLNGTIFGIPEKIWDDNVVQKLKFKNSRTKSQTPHRDGMVSNILAEVNENNESNIEAQDNFELEEFAADFTNEDTPIYESETFDAPVSNVTEGKQWSNFETLQSKIRKSRLTKDSSLNDLSKVGSLLNNLTSDIKNMAESWYMNGRALFTGSTKAPAATEEDNSNRLSKIWNSVVGFASDVYAQLANFATWVHEKVKEYIHAIDKELDKLRGQLEKKYK